MSMIAIRRATAVSVATVALAVPVGLTAEPASAANKYPAGAEQAWMKTCVKLGKQKGMTATKARRFCRRTFKCFERKLTLQEFLTIAAAVNSGKKNYPNKKVFLTCAKNAAK